LTVESVFCWQCPRRGRNPYASSSMSDRGSRLAARVPCARAIRRRLRFKRTLVQTAAERLSCQLTNDLPDQHATAASAESERTCNPKRRIAGNPVMTPCFRVIGRTGISQIKTGTQVRGRRTITLLLNHHGRLMPNCRLPNLAAGVCGVNDGKSLSRVFEPPGPGPQDCSRSPRPRDARHHRGSLGRHARTTYHQCNRQAHLFQQSLRDH